MAIPTHSHYIGREAKATLWLIQWLCGEPKVPVREAMRIAMACSTDRECGCAASRPHEDSAGRMRRGPFVIWQSTEQAYPSNDLFQWNPVWR
jgi:hypothetical protein